MRILGTDESFAGKETSWPLTVITKQKLVIYPVDSHRPKVFSFPYKVKGSVGWIEKSLRIKTLEVDNLEAFRAPYTELRFQEVDRARLHGNVEFLRRNEPHGHHTHEKIYSERLQRIIPALQNLTERRFTPSANVLVNWFQCLNRTRQRTRFDDTNKDFS